MKKRGPKPRNIISTRWTPELAYVVGLIVSDGNLSTDRRHLEFNSKDLQLVELFKNCLSLKNKIGTKTNGYTNNFHIQFGSIQFYNWLLSIGLKPNKSKTLGSVIIPDIYFFDFLRGYFDGDGSIYSYWSSQWSNSYVIYLAFISASPNFLKWLQIRIFLLTEICGNIGEVTRAQKLSFGKEATKKIYAKMFYSESVPCLERKRLKAKLIFDTEFQHKLARVAEPGIRV